MTDGVTGCQIVPGVTLRKSYCGAVCFRYAEAMSSPGGGQSAVKKFFQLQNPWSIWFWVFLAFSLALFVAGIKEAWEAWRSHSWVQTECVILHSAAETKSNGDYDFSVSYQYEFQ